MPGYFGIGIYHPSKQHNIGTLWRSATAFRANLLFTIGTKYSPQSSDTTRADNQIPLFTYSSFEDLRNHLPRKARLVAVELAENAQKLSDFVHPEQAIYLLGNEGSGLPKKVLEACHHIVEIPVAPCLNVATAGSIIMYDRFSKLKILQETA